MTRSRTSSARLRSARRPWGPTDLARESGDLATATSTIERAKAIAEVAPGPRHPTYHTVVMTLGEIQLAAGKRAEAKRTLDDLIVLELANQTSELPATLAARAEIALGESKWADALGFADRAIASLEASHGKDSADLWLPLAARGRALVALKQPKDAKVALTRAIEIGTKAKVKPADLGPARAALSAL